jgi:hypothetical protein
MSRIHNTALFFTYVSHINDVDDIAVAVLILTVGEDFTITCVGNSVRFPAPVLFSLMAFKMKIFFS